MNNYMQNFSGYTTYAQNTMYQPTPMRVYPQNNMMSRSPDFLAAQNGYSPLVRMPMNSYGYQRNNASSPVINLMQCAHPAEEAITEPSTAELAKKASNLKLRHRLSCKSKAFVKKDEGSKPNDRKASSDTKAHTEDEVHSSDSEDLENGADKSAPLVLRKAVTTFQKKSPTEDAIGSEEKPQTAFRTKFKTELCKNWQAGECKFGSKCAFAHGFEELSEKKHLPNNYKTKICKQFHEELYCSYGSRCQFIHLNNAEEEQQSILSKAINILADLRPTKKVSRGRLSVFKTLAN